MNKPQHDLGLDLESTTSSTTSSTNSPRTLDDLLGPLELALSYSDLHLQQSRITTERHFQEHHHQPPSIPFNSSKSYKTASPPHTHHPTCESSTNPPTSPSELECPICTQTLPPHSLLPHFLSTGTSECKHYWRCLSVIGKKSLYPEYDLSRYEDLLLEMCDQEQRDSPIDEMSSTRSWTPTLSFSEGLYSEEGTVGSDTVGGSDTAGGPDTVEGPETVGGFDTLGATDEEEELGYCPNCGLGVVDGEGFLEWHLWGCLERAVGEGMVGGWDTVTGGRVSEMGVDGVDWRGSEREMEGRMEECDDGVGRNCRMAGEIAWGNRMAGF